MEKLLIVDGHNLLFRMFYGIPGSIKNTKGKEIKGTVGFVGSLYKLIDKLSPDRMILVFDSETSINNRLDEYSEYKQNRIDYSRMEENENPFTQLQYIYKAIKHLEIAYIEARDYEADDYIASLCQKYKERYDIVVVSTDRDFLQLVDKNIVVYNPMGKEGVFYTPDKVQEKYSINPNQVIDYKALVGDKSDNINGVKGIGAKTAVKILKCGSLYELLNQDKEVEEKLYNKLNTNRAIIERNKALITMKRNIDVNIDVSTAVVNMNTRKRTMELLKECGVY